jgi:hypothetical protein
VARHAIAAETCVVRTAVGGNPTGGRMAIGTCGCRFDVSGRRFANSWGMRAIMARFTTCRRFSMIKGCRRPGNSRRDMTTAAVVGCVEMATRLPRCLRPVVTRETRARDKCVVNLERNPLRRVTVTAFA